MFKIWTSLINKSNMSHIAENIVYDNNGVYEFYNQYVITKKDNTYIVTKKNVYLEQPFYSLRNAVIWISLDKRNKLVEAKDVLSLDIKLASAIYSMKHYNELSKRSKDLDKKSLYVCKYKEGSEKKRQTILKLDEYASETTRWQEQKYAQVTKN